MSVPSGFQRHFDGPNPCATAAHDADGALCPWVPTLIKMSVVACTPLIVFLVRLAILKRRVSSNTYKDLETNAQAASLQQAKSSAALVTFGVQGGAAACGWLLMVFGLWSNFVMPDEWPLPPFFCMLPWPPGGALLLLAVRPNEKTAAAVATGVLTFVEAFFVMVCTVMIPGLIRMFTYDNHPLTFLLPLSGLVNAACLASIIPNYFCEGCCGAKDNHPRVKLGRLWRSYRLFLMSMSQFFIQLSLTAFGVYGERPSTDDPAVLFVPGGNPDHAPGAFMCAAMCIAVAAAMTPAVRRDAHAALGSLAAQSEAKAAAAVAGLVGGRSASAALQHGRDTFRGLPFSGLSENDFTSSADTGLHAKTRKVDLGDVHAFLSHSWHDEAAPKWSVLAAWGAKRQEPLLWLDKACIDQQRIDESLAALPVYLSGCQDLLVIVGPTYTRRLWCGPPLPPHHAPARTRAPTSRRAPAPGALWSCSPSCRCRDRSSASLPSRCRARRCATSSAHSTPRQRSATRLRTERGCSASSRAPTGRTARSTTRCGASSRGRRARRWRRRRLLGPAAAGTAESTCRPQSSASRCNS